MMGLWCSTENVIFKVIKCGLADDVEMSKLSLFADVIIMGLAACVLLTVLIDGQIIQKVVAYYQSKRATSKLKCGQVCAPQPSKIATVRPQPLPMPPMPFRRDPNCPCHGDNVRVRQR